jgi:hypothetical protein
MSLNNNQSLWYLRILGLSEDAVSVHQFVGLIGFFKFQFISLYPQEMLFKNIFFYSNIHAFSTNMLSSLVNLYNSFYKIK